MTPPTPIPDCGKIDSGIDDTTIRGKFGMKAEIIAIGTELVSGQSLDTNSQWLSQQLGMLGIPVHFHSSVGDDMDENVVAFRLAVERADLVITSGGLGPTQDDLTRDVLARMAGVGLREDPDSLAAIEALFARRNRTMTERNRVQAQLPLGADALANPIGTAPGMMMAVGSALVACLPGVPSEMKRMFADQVVPAAQASRSDHQVHRPPQDQPVRQGGVRRRGRRPRSDRAGANPRGRDHRVAGDHRLPDRRRGGHRGRGPSRHRADRRPHL